jgi:hypothetical protein
MKSKIDIKSVVVGVVLGVFADTRHGSLRAEQHGRALSDCGHRQPRRRPRYGDRPGLVRVLDAEQRQDRSGVLRAQGGEVARALRPLRLIHTTFHLAQMG